MAYTDLTDAFAYRDLVVWSKMDQLAENDAYNHFPSGTRTFFYQETAPAAWTKLTTTNDKILRVVSGSGGGTGGSHAPSAAVEIEHSHTVAHVHTHPSHTHLLDYDIDATKGIGSIRVVSASGTGNLLQGNFGNPTTGRIHKNIFQGTAAPDLGSASPGTSNGLTDFTLAYADVIVCEKD